MTSDVIIIGGGISGLNMGIQLKRQLGINNFTILEKGSELGGTWFYNKYPGAGCDVPSHFYSLSYEPNPDWSQLFSPADEIKEYLVKTAEKYDMLRHFSFNTKCLGARWNTEKNIWHVDLFDSIKDVKYQKTCRVLVSAVGVLSLPCDPLPGTKDFGGPAFHSSAWDYGVDLKDKDVLLIGNGCSATQIVPSIIDEVRSVKQFVRGQQYFLERPQFQYSAFSRWMFRHVPLVQRLYRWLICYSMDSNFKIFYKDAVAYRGKQEREAKEYMLSNTPTKYLDMIMPKFSLGVKRRVFDTGYLQALHKANLILSDTPIKKVVTGGLQLETGEIVKGDILVHCNGFKAQDFLVPMEIIGDKGQNLHDRWRTQGGARAYLGTSISGFPNFFTILSAHTLQGHSS